MSTASTAREALLSAALAALTELPWSSVRMVDVASAAGVSRQTLYNEFGSKDGLARALVRREADLYLHGVERLLDGGGDRPAPDRLVALAEWTVGQARARPLLRALLTGCWGEWLPAPRPVRAGAAQSPVPAQRRADAGAPATTDLVALVRDRTAAALHHSRTGDHARPGDRSRTGDRSWPADPVRPTEHSRAADRTAEPARLPRRPVRGRTAPSPAQAPAPPPAVLEPTGKDAPGSWGPLGQQGPQGQQGLRGQQALQGQQEAQAPQGVQGAPGSQGAPGAQGSLPGRADLLHRCELAIRLALAHVIAPGAEPVGPFVRTAVTARISAPTPRAGAR